jgi:hypothetical protein
VAAVAAEVPLVVLGVLGVAVLVLLTTEAVLLALPTRAVVVVVLLAITVLVTRQVLREDRALLLFVTRM